MCSVHEDGEGKLKIMKQFKVGFENCYSSSYGIAGRQLYVPSPSWMPTVVTPLLDANCSYATPKRQLYSNATAGRQHYCSYATAGRQM